MFLQIDFGSKQIVVRNSKGEKDQTTMLPEIVIEPLKNHLQKVKKIHEEDLKNGSARYIYLMLLKENIQMQNMIGGGSIFFLQQKIQRIREPVFNEDIIYTIQ